MSTKVNINEEWKNQSEVFVNVEGDWKRVATSYVNIEGEWKQSTLGGAPDRPILNWNSTGKFEIVGYKSYLVYTPTLISGSGSANLDPSTGIFILTGVDSAFNVTASYAIDAPESEVSYMERKARTTKLVLIGYKEGQVCPPDSNRVADCNTNPSDPSYNGAQCPTWCPCYDSPQNRCICWTYGPPYCYGTGQPDTSQPIYDTVDDTKWSGDPYFYTDRGTEWSKQF